MSSAKRHAIAASAVYVDGEVRVEGAMVGGVWPGGPLPYRLALRTQWVGADVQGPRVDFTRAFAIAEQTALVEGALSDRHVVEVARVNLAATPEHVRPGAGL